ncbi:MAG: DUF4386 domain-containing protein [Steroidobacteraceae bacterium]
MRSAKNVGRIVGILLSAQIVVAFLAQFVLLARVSAPPGFLANAAGSVLQVRVSVLLWFVASALTLAVAITALPVFRQYSERMALLYLALSVLGLSTSSVDNVTVLNMLALSQEYAKAGAANELLQALGEMARSSRYAAHYVNLLVGGITAFVFVSILFRFALVPRALAAFGLVAFPVQIAAVAMPLLGYRYQAVMLIPAALSLLMLVLWLIAKGFDERQLELD